MLVAHRDGYADVNVNVSLAAFAALLADVSGVSTFCIAMRECLA